MHDFSATYLGTNKRRGFAHLIEVFDPRAGIVSQYVNGTPMGDGRLLFGVDRDHGFETYAIEPTVYLRQVPGAPRPKVTEDELLDLRFGKPAL